MSAFEKMLSGGHPNSLGRTIEVVDLVLSNPERMEELFCCYQSTDEVVRLRTSNAMKRIEKENPDLVLPYLDRLIDEIGELDQASAQWTIAQLFLRLSDSMSRDQKERALKIMKRNLSKYTDWIVLNATVETLGAWAREDRELMNWMRPCLETLSKDERKTVRQRAKRHLEILQ